VYSNSTLKKENGVVVDAKYRGKASSRKDVFDEPDTVSVASTDDDDDDDNEVSDEFDDEEVSSDGASQLDDEGIASSGSDSTSEGDEEDDDQQDRRDKVRQLIAQESKYIPFLRI
jgi:protein AATF/BFR2